MKIEGLQEFIALAQNMNFSKTAKSLHLSQSALSYHISAMEKELGFKLVDRGGRPSLTPMGKRFLVGAEKIVSSYTQLVENCKTAAESILGTLVFEKPVCSPSLDQALNRLILDFSIAASSVHVKHAYHAELTLMDALRSRKVDVGFSYLVKRSSGSSLPPNVDFAPLPLKVCRSGYIWLHKDDPLAEKDELEFADLSGRSVILPLGSHYKAFSDAMKAAIEEAGAAAEFIYKPGSLTEVALSIAYDELALISGCDIDDYRFAVVPDRVFRPVAPSCNELGFYALFLRGNDNPALSAFLDFAVEQGV